MGRKKEGKIDLHVRVKVDTPTALGDAALSLGLKYGKGGATGKMLDMIADGEILLTRVQA